MAPLTLETVKENIKALTPEQQRQLREWWNTQEIAEPAAITEAELQQRLLKAGIIRHIPPPITDVTPYNNRTPVPITGKPLSETVIEERR